MITIILCSWRTIFMRDFLHFAHLKVSDIYRAACQEGADGITKSDEK